MSLDDSVESELRYYFDQWYVEDFGGHAIADNADIVCLGCHLLAKLSVASRRAQYSTGIKAHCNMATDALPTVTLSTHQRYFSFCPTMLGTFSKQGESSRADFKHPMIAEPRLAFPRWPRKH